jgi:hypothetical protein
MAPTGTDALAEYALLFRPRSSNYLIAIGALFPQLA